MGQNGSEIKNSICKTGLYYLVYGYFFRLNTELIYSKEKKIARSPIFWVERFSSKNFASQIAPALGLFGTASGAIWDSLKKGTKTSKIVINIIKQVSTCKNRFFYKLVTNISITLLILELTLGKVSQIAPEW